MIYPKEDSILIKRRGEQELKQLRNSFLLDAIGKNNDPKNSRLFDTKMQSDSPKKVLHVWTEKFGSATKPKQIDLNLSKTSKSPIKVAQSESIQPGVSAKSVKEQAAEEVLAANPEQRIVEISRVIRGAERRVDLIQSQIRDSMWELQTQGLSPTQKELCQAQEIHRL